MLSQGSAWRRPGAAPATSSRHRLGRRRSGVLDIHRHCEHAINHADSASRLPADTARKDAGPS